jgi:hypothetical protein
MYTDELGLFVGPLTNPSQTTVMAGSRVVPVAGALLAGVAVGTAINEKWGPDIAEAIDKICPPGGRQPQDHRGRIQAQGNSTGPSVNVSSNWAQKTPLTKAEGFAHLHLTVIQIPPRQLHRFTKAISKAADHIANTATKGPSVYNAYQDGNMGRLRGAERIDIEVWQGLAF